MINDAFPYSNGALSGQAAWSVATYSGTLTVASSAVTGTAGNTYGNLRSDTWESTQSSTIEVTSSGTHTGAFVGVILHGSNSGGLNGYTFGFSLSSIDGSAQQFYLERVAGGSTAETLDTDTLGGVSPVGKTFGIAIDGNDVVGYFDGVEVARGTNTDHRTGKPGVLIYFDGAASPVLDNWVGTGESGGGGGTPNTEARKFGPRSFLRTLLNM